MSTLVLTATNPRDGASATEPIVVTGGTDAVSDSDDATFVDISEGVSTQGTMVVDLVGTLPDGSVITAGQAVYRVSSVGGVNWSGDVAADIEGDNYTPYYASLASRTTLEATPVDITEDLTFSQVPTFDEINAGTVQLGLSIGKSAPYSSGGTLRVFQVTVTLTYEDPTALDEPDDPDQDTVEEPVWTGVEDESDVPTDEDLAVDQDLTSVGMIRRISETYPAPTLDPETGRPIDWRPDEAETVDEVWGKIGVIVDGHHVTTVRGVKTVIDKLTFQEPFGEGPGQLTIGGASAWDRGRDGFEWMRVEANVDINRYDVDGHFVASIWSGIVLTVQWSNGSWTMGIEGAFAGVAGMLPHRPKLTEAERDWGKAMTYAIRRAGRAASRRKTIAEETFGITTRDRGARSETLLEYVTRGLSMCQTVDGEQWTLARARNGDGHPIQRKYLWRLKQHGEAEITVRLGQRGVTVDLRQDLADVTRLIMGEGVNRDGGRWRNTKLPNVGKETVPPYPGTPLDIGSDGDDVTVWQIEAESDGHPTGNPNGLSGVAFGDNDAQGASEIQESAGLSITGIVDEDTWNATWSNGDSDLNLGGSRFDPIWIRHECDPFLYSSNGSVMAVNEDWDRSKIPVGRFVSYGQDVTKKQGRASAHAEIAKGHTPAWSGTIELDGVDPPQMSRHDILEGLNIQVLGFDDEPVMHIAGAEWSPSPNGFRVLLHVDERRRDLLTLADIRARNREARQDPAKAAIAQLRRSTQARDTPAMWDAEGGFGLLPVRDVHPGWNVFRVAAGKYGSLSRVRIQVTPAERFVVAAFGAQVKRSWLVANVPNPLAKPADSDPTLWDAAGLKEALRDRWFIEAWGGYHQAGGYSPGAEYHPATGKATGDSVTGLLDTDTSTEYGLLDEPKLWLCVWLDGDADATARGQIYLLPNE